MDGDGHGTTLTVIRCAGVTDAVLTIDAWAKCVCAGNTLPLRIIAIAAIGLIMCPNEINGQD